MFNSRTLFIIGAGASKEANLPVGYELASQIAEDLYFEFESYKGLVKGDHNFYQRIRQHVNPERKLNANYETELVNEYLRAARTIHDGIYLAGSIDNFIDTHRDDNYVAECGKASIVKSILNAERNSKLNVDHRVARPSLDMRELEGTWYVQFAQILCERVAVGNLNEIFENISIICFNYDRCIEQFLTFALQPLFSITQEEAEELVASLCIYHPYGTVGSLRGRHNPNGLPFGADPEQLSPFHASQQLKTFTERIEEDDALKELRSEVQRAETIVFLGFAFHPQNMELISPSGAKKVKRVISTAKGISEPDKMVVTSQIRSMLESKSKSADNEYSINLHNELTCNQLLLTYRRSLSLVTPV